jgi:hypothetical protein
MGSFLEEKLRSKSYGNIKEKENLVHFTSFHIIVAMPELASE